MWKYGEKYWKMSELFRKMSNTGGEPCKRKNTKFDFFQQTCIIINNSMEKRISSPFFTDNLYNHFGEENK